MTALLHKMVDNFAGGLGEFVPNPKF